MISNSNAERRADAAWSAAMEAGTDAAWSAAEVAARDWEAAARQAGDEAAAHVAARMAVSASRHGKVLS